MSGHCGHSFFFGITERGHYTVEFEQSYGARGVCVCVCMCVWWRWGGVKAPTCTGLSFVPLTDTWQQPFLFINTGLPCVVGFGSAASHRGRRERKRCASLKEHHDRDKLPQTLGRDAGLKDPFSCPLASHPSIPVPLRPPSLPPSLRWNHLVLPPIDRKSVV